jgi:anti-sigma28 factor (negative regulator of flagellin synthesis)
MSNIFDANAVNIQKPIQGKLDPVASATTKRAGPPNFAAADSDHVETNAQNRLHALALAVGDTERANRVEQLRGLVQSGNYHVDTNALSQAIVDAMHRGS